MRHRRKLWKRQLLATEACHGEPFRSVDGWTALSWLLVDGHADPLDQPRLTRVELVTTIARTRYDGFCPSNWVDRKYMHDL